MDENPRGFGLIQRERDFAHYQDVESQYQARPSYWVEPLGNWGKGGVELVEIPSDEKSTTTRIQDVEGHDVPAADFVQQVFFRQLAIFQENRRCRAAVDAHFVLFVAGLESGEGALDDEGGEFLAVNLRENDVNIGEAALVIHIFCPLRT